MWQEKDFVLLLKSSDFFDILYSHVNGFRHSLINPCWSYDSRIKNKRKDP
jgi:hypothetical protein